MDNNRTTVITKWNDPQDMVIAALLQLTQFSARNITHAETTELLVRLLVSVEVANINEDK